MYPFRFLIIRIFEEKTRGGYFFHGYLVWLIVTVFRLSTIGGNIFRGKEEVYVTTVMVS